MTTQHENEFSSGRPLILSSIKGTRSFRVNNGKLTSVVREDFVYKPGINIATCELNEFHELMNNHYRLAKVSEEYHYPTHRVGSKNCTCGFYAYHDPRWDGTFHIIGNIKGVIECSGLVTQGSKGFRAERAKVIALQDPRYDFFNRFTNFLMLLTLIAVTLNVTMMFYTMMSKYFSGDQVYINIIFTLFLLVAFSYYLFVSFFSDKGFYKSLKGRKIDAQAIQQLKANYPDVKWYKTTRKMLKDHPEIRHHKKK